MRERERWCKKRRMGRLWGAAQVIRCEPPTFSEDKACSSVGGDTIVATYGY